MSNNNLEIKENKIVTRKIIFFFQLFVGLYIAVITFFLLINKPSYYDVPNRNWIFETILMSLPIIFILTILGLIIVFIAKAVAKLVDKVEFPESKLSSDEQIKKIKNYLAKENTQKARYILRKLKKNYPKHPLIKPLHQEASQIEKKLLLQNIKAIIIYISIPIIILSLVQVFQYKNLKNIIYSIYYWLPMIILLVFVIYIIFVIFLIIKNLISSYFKNRDNFIRKQDQVYYNKNNKKLYLNFKLYAIVLLGGISIILYDVFVNFPTIYKYFLVIKNVVIHEISLMF